MLLNSGWHSPLVQDGEAGGGAASAWFSCEINLEEKHSYPVELFEQKTTVNNFGFCLLSNKVWFWFLFCFLKQKQIHPP